MKKILEKLKNLLPKKKNKQETTADNALNENTSTQNVDSNATQDIPSPGDITRPQSSADPVDDASKKAKEKKRKMVIYSVVGVLVAYLILDTFTTQDDSGSAEKEMMAAQEKAMKEKIAKRKSKSKKQKKLPPAQAQAETVAIKPTQVNTIESPAGSEVQKVEINANPVAETSSNPSPSDSSLVPENVEAQVQQSLDQVSDEVTKKIDQQNGLEDSTNTNSISESNLENSAKVNNLNEQTSQNTNIQNNPVPEQEVNNSNVPENPETASVENVSHQPSQVINSNELKGTMVRDLAKENNQNTQKDVPNDNNKSPNDLQAMEDVSVNLKELSVPSPEDQEMPTHQLNENKNPETQVQNAANSNANTKANENIDLSKIGENKGNVDSNTNNKIDLQAEQTQDSSESKNLISDLEHEAEGRAPAESEAKKKMSQKRPTYDFPGRALVYNCEGKHWACVDRVPYFQCVENHKWSEKNSKAPSCIPEKIYFSDEDCHLAQMTKINSLVSPKCNLK